MRRRLIFNVLRTCFIKLIMSLLMLSRESILGGGTIRLESILKSWTLLRMLHCYSSHASLQLFNKAVLSSLLTCTLALLTHTLKRASLRLVSSCVS